MTHAAQTGAAVVAEGIEDERQLDLARGYGADFGQGYFLGRPSPLPTQMRTPHTTVPLLSRVTDKALAPTPFASLVDGVSTRALGRPTMLELLRQLMNQVMTLDPAPVVLLQLPAEENLTPELVRLLAAVARRSPLAALLGGGNAVTSVPGLRAGPLSALGGDPVTSHGDDVAMGVISPYYGAALAGRPTAGHAGGAAAMYDAALTFDRNVAVRMSTLLFTRLPAAVDRGPSPPPPDAPPNRTDTSQAIRPGGSPVLARRTRRGCDAVFVVDQRGAEPEVDEAFDRLVEEGETRLSRPILTMISTGVLGGIDVGTGVLAYLLVDARYDNVLLAGVVFAIGFVALLLAKSELFTENFLVPLVAVVARRNSLTSVARLWAITLAANLAGGWLAAWMIVTARPDLKSTAIKVGSHYAALGVNTRSFLLAVLAGIVITLMTRMQHATDSLGVRIVPAVLFGALLAGAQLFHCVLDSIFMFTALISRAPFGYLDWLEALGWSALGNIVGGTVLVTGLRLLRVPHKVAAEREANDPDT